MQETQTDILSDIVMQINKVRRKDLLPWWIKLFSYIFLVLGALALPGIVFGILGYQFSLSLLGLTTTEPFSIDGIVIMTLFVFKATISYGLLWEKDWAVILGIIDAILSISICLLMMFYSLLELNGGNISLRLELVILIPYLFRLLKIRSIWEQAVKIR
jgi:hypothetical protein